MEIIDFFLKLSRHDTGCKIAGGDLEYLDHYLWGWSRSVFKYFTSTDSFVSLHILKITTKHISKYSYILWSISMAPYLQTPKLSKHFRHKYVFICFLISLIIKMCKLSSLSATFCYFWA